MTTLCIEQNFGRTDTYRCSCNNCGKQLTNHELSPIQDAQERLTPGEETPAGECPDCFALAFVDRCEGTRRFSQKSQDGTASEESAPQQAVASEKRVPRPTDGPEHSVAHRQKQSISEMSIVVEDGSDLELADGARSCWLGVDGLSVHIVRSDEGVVVDIFEQGKEMEDSIASTYAFRNEIGDGEE